MHFHELLSNNFVTALATSSIGCDTEHASMQSGSPNGTAMVQISKEFAHIHNCQEIMTIKEKKFSNVLKYFFKMQTDLIFFLCGILLH